MSEGIWFSALICGLLLAVSAVLMRSHRRTWRLAQSRPPNQPGELDYHRRRFRRRAQTSAMLGLLGIAILAGHFIQPPMPILLVLAFWLGVILLVVWIMLLAVADAISTRMHFGRLRRLCQSERTRLHAEIRRLEKTRGNGKAGADEAP